MFEWDEFLVLADELASRSTEEAATRSAISRAYYAAFHAGRDYLTRANIVIDTSGQAHQQIQRELQARDFRVGGDLARLHRWRKQADYAMVCSFVVHHQAVDAVALARAIIERIRTLS